jgi:DNA-binding transcriptional regulator GbsR (MarR family)
VVGVGVSGQVSIPPELEDLANEIGEFICFWGFKKIHGRIWTHIFLAHEALDAGQLMTRLKVSKALISLSLNDLLRYEVILEAHKSARGTQTYIANPNVLDVILNVLRRRERKMLARTESSHKMLETLNSDSLVGAQISLERVQALGGMIGQAQSAFNGLLELANVDFNGWSKLNVSSNAK